MTTTMGTARYRFGGGVFSGRLVVFGGLRGATPLADGESSGAVPSGVDSWSHITSLPSARHSGASTVHRGIAYQFGGLDTGGGFTNTVYYTPLRTPSARTIYSKLVDLGSDQSVTTITTNGGGSNGRAMLELRSATTASPAFGAITTASMTFGTPVSYPVTARYLFLRYTLDDTLSVTVNPDSTAHLAIDDISIATTSPPAAPANLEQRQDDDFVLIAVGKGANSATIFVHADISDPDGDNLRLHVEVKPVGAAFTNTPTASSLFTTSPNSLSLQVAGLAAGTSYHWQAWVEDIGGAIGPKTSFGGNTDPNDVDFFVDQPPAPPVAMGQFESDGVTPILDNGTTLSNTVILKGARADPDALSLVKVQLEIQPAATPFTDTFTNESSFLAPGLQASFTLSGLAAGGYHWQMRCVDDNGKVSTPWTPFSASPTHFTVVSNQPPNPPSNLLQFENDGATPIAFGSNAAAAAVKFQADLSDPNIADQLKFQVELRPTGIAFTSPGTPVIDNVVFFESLVAPQGTLQLAVTIPSDGTWHWQARTVDTSGAASAWTSAGGNPDPNGVDVGLNLVNDPPIVTAPGQFQSDGTTSIAIGGNATTLGVVFKATVTDPEGAAVTLEIELRNLLTGLSASATHTAGPVASGSTISVPATPAIDGYHWAYRATDGVTFSAWTSFGGNPEANADFNVANNGAPVISALAQFMADAVTPLPLGQSTTGTVVLQAVVTDPEGQAVLLRVEVKPVGTAFDGLGTISSGLVASGSTIQVTVPGLADGAYHWRAAGVDVQATAGTAASFGANPETDPDFRVDTTNSAPTAPTGLGQYVPPGTVGLALGGAPFGRTVILKATATDDELSQIAFEVEVQPLGTAFVNAATHATQLGPAGVERTITLDDLAGGAWHWQIRARDAQGLFSAWTSYGGNSESAADFEITATVAVPPNAPLNLKQRLVNDLVDIEVAEVIDEAAVRLKALVVHPRTEIVKLQVEVRPISQPFTGADVRESGFVDSGTVAQVVVSGIPNDAWRWRARTVDSKGTTSAWIDFGGNAETDGDFVVAVPVNNPPADPPFVLQYQANGTSLIPAGGTTTQSSVTFSAIALDPDGDPAQLEVELKPIGAPFDGALSGSTAFLPTGTTIYLRIGSLPSGRFHWRARMTDANGSSSAWVAYGGNPESDADVIVNSAANSAPALAAALEQLREDGTIAVALGEFAAAGDLTFRSDASDADPEDLLRLEVEVRATGEPLTSAATHAGDFVPQGFVADAVVGRFLFDVPCHWAARVVDVNGATSGWIEFGGNPSGETDFIPSFSIAGSVSRKKCGSFGLDLLLPVLLLLCWKRK
jgi:hypothetical protein